MNIQNFFLNKKNLFTLVSIFSIVGYGTFVFAAPNLLFTPSGGYAPGTELDPVCTPNQITPEPCIVKLPSGGGSFTASNGLTAAGTDVKLGGALIANTVIDQGNFDFSITGQYGAFKASSDPLNLAPITGSGYPGMGLVTDGTATGGLSQLSGIVHDGTTALSVMGNFDFHDREASFQAQETRIQIQSRDSGNTSRLIMDNGTFKIETSDSSFVNEDNQVINSKFLMSPNTVNDMYFDTTGTYFNGLTFDENLYGETVKTWSGLASRGLNGDETAAVIGTKRGNQAYQVIAGDGINLWAKNYNTSATTSLSIFQDSATYKSSTNNLFTFATNSAIVLPVGTDLERPTGINGMIRYSTDNNCVEGYTSNILSWGCLGGTSGGATSPAGSTYEIQFNDAGNFGASPGFTYNSSSKRLSVSGSAGPTGGGSFFQFGGDINYVATGSLQQVMLYDTEDSYIFIGEGNSGTYTGGSDTILGTRSISIGFNSPVASGDMSVVLGGGVKSPSYGESTVGVLNTNYTPNSATTWNTADRLFTVGGGENQLSKSDALTILKNGQTGIAIDNFEANTNGNIFQVGDGSTGVIGYVNSGTGAWVAVSDARKKDNITNLTYGLDTIMNLSPKSYTMKSNGEHSIGFLAQDVLSIVPESVFGSQEKGYGMSYSTLVPVTVKAIQELNMKLSVIESVSNTNNTTFLTNLRNWFADSMNGIGDLFANVIHSKESHTEKLCVGDTCVTEAQLQQLLQLQNNNSIPVSNSAPVISTPEPAPVISEPVPPVEAEPPVITPESVPDTSLVPDPVEEIIPISEDTPTTE